jgi:fumarylacetoacetate (FAA) hydrolase family protein
VPKRVPGSELLPKGEKSPLLIGRVWSNAQGGPCVAMLLGEELFDISDVSATMSGLLELPSLPEKLKGLANQPRLGMLDDFLSFGGNSGPAGMLLAPCDLQAIKAAGVTFADSMLERVIDERATGNPALADRIRRQLERLLGGSLRGLKVGSPAVTEVTAILKKNDLWSQYLEVGLGPYAEIFTKAQPMAAVGAGAMIGIHPISDWNNPEPEIVLAVSSAGEITGATLGNDVNLRDVEGRSALLLGKAKDNNASCAIGPFIRLLDQSFSIADLETLTVELLVVGQDGFRLVGESSMSAISRSPTELVRHAMGSSHQYPDGFMLFLGTMFAPVQDRRSPGMGFTHEIGDEVRISAPGLGTLINWVDRCDAIPPWTFGARALIRNLTDRGLSGRV